MVPTIRYTTPLNRGGTIAVTAPSSGVEEPQHPWLDAARRRLEAAGYRVVEEETARTQCKGVSAPAEKRAAELTSFLADREVDAVIPPWGGKFLMEVLPLIDWERLAALPPKWVLGYSDTSTFLLPYTLLTGIATAHGTNFINMRCARQDPVSRRWCEVLSLSPGSSLLQRSSERYQSNWSLVEDRPDANMALDTPTEWKVLGGGEARMEGRLLGGCLDTLRMLAGTPYAPVAEWAAEREEGVLWYLESAELSAGEIYRALWQMKESGWFTNARGLLFGRPANYESTGDFDCKDALEAVFAPLGIPVVYDADVGHLPPQLTLVNGALARVEAAEGAGTVETVFR